MIKLKIVLYVIFVNQLIGMNAQALIELKDLPTINLPAIVPGSTTQPVEDVPQREFYSVFVNDGLYGQSMNVPGWSNETNQKPNYKTMIEVYGVRTTSTPATSAESVFHVGANVGRSGVWEKQASGDYFAIINGKPKKGLTIKGYGGNTVVGKQAQPEGSLDAAEAYRDTLLSKILIERNVDTYTGAYTVVRPTAAGKMNANYIRISRSTLRMNDLIDRKGADLRATVDHLRTLIADEVGEVYSEKEFSQWLVKATAETLAGKEHARVSASNDNKDNLGIAELVDFGEAKYNPYEYKEGYDLTNGWSKGLRAHPITAAENIAHEYGFKIDAGKLFDDAYKAKKQELEKTDAARIFLERASVDELKAIGLTEESAAKIVDLQAKLPFGILTLDDVTSVLANSNDVAIVKSKTTTNVLKMEDGHIIPNAVFEEVGGGSGLREIMMQAIGSSIVSKNVDLSKLNTALSFFTNDKMSEERTMGYRTSYNTEYGVKIPNFVIRQVLPVISAAPEAAIKTMQMNRLTVTPKKCVRLFGI